MFFSVMVIGFTSRSQTVSEGDSLGADVFPITINVAANRISEREHFLLLRYQEVISLATVGPFSRFGNFDSNFGEGQVGEPPEHFTDLLPGQSSTSFEVYIYNDFIPEEQECFSIRISPVDVVGRRELFECNEQGPSYFCEHTICIEDDDGKSLKLQAFLTFISPVEMVIGFSKGIYTAIETDGYVEVCVDVPTPGMALRNFTVALLPEEGICFHH